ncbi:hypothetical protein PGSY75_0613200 [Plasmodium gaboni]|uniref:Uncharacterized protein n=1 Tax=Plasmodium gaboni TaxID=647221 RepID=A0A151LRK0_9APIC|nr:hypothetical protein PGSY75_0613200 [Plasmodium gaboni]XP_028537280.1 conserved Plasmodium protein, unknown function [Plasmodium sp. gorilla clade G2]KYO01828.1 hypothetical protein PGSY75_0613200 [Plasmodium gaboni]SOV12256.1 conserved Plasmodium protein, unknown function [Plasmodium gaboni]SOV12540.1 conserved Plasmodium protein, unknown function [Plasmodium sp. gorilla clade G2]
MKRFLSWCTCVIIGTAIPLGLSTLSLWYLNVDKEKNEIHSYNNEYRRKQRENLLKEKSSN